jgi:hypothetical protein
MKLEPNRDRHALYVYASDWRRKATGRFVPCLDTEGTGSVAVASRLEETQGQRADPGKQAVGGDLPSAAGRGLMQSVSPQRCKL